MAELKTQRNKASIAQFLSSIDDEQRRKDGKALFKLFKEVVQEKPEMWGTSIVGFGSFHYQSDRSSQSGDWFLTGFSPRKQNLTVYVINGPQKYPELLSKLGKYKISTGSCIYINRLSEIDTEVLKLLIEKSVKEMKAKYKVK